MLGSVNGALLLYDGGMRKSYREQSSALVQMMQEEARRTDLKIADSVRRMYWGAVLARQLAPVGLRHPGPDGSDAAAH